MPPRAVLPGRAPSVPAPTPGLKQGTVTWHVDRGERGGYFAGASGLIASNFFVDRDRRGR